MLNFEAIAIRRRDDIREGFFVFVFLLQSQRLPTPDVVIPHLGVTKTIHKFRPVADLTIISSHRAIRIPSSIF